jgi:hypothetical protein
MVIFMVCESKLLMHRKAVIVCVRACMCVHTRVCVWRASMDMGRRASLGMK